MPWLNLGDLLRELLQRRIDPEDIGVYVPEPGPKDEKTDVEEE